MSRLLPSIYLLFLAGVFFTFTRCKSASKSTAPVSDTAHNSQNSVDWAGTYSGVLPCADCEGIQTTIILKENLTYQEQIQYLGKENVMLKYNGTFFWNNEGNTITLQNKEQHFADSYFVGENTLTRLDTEGRKVLGKLAQHYILSKDAFEIKEKYWKLTEVFGNPVKPKVGFIKDSYIIFKEAENHYIGNTGCNSISGTYSAFGTNRLIINPGPSTLMACANMEIETLFLKALKTTDSYLIVGDTLILHRARMAPLAKFEQVLMN